MKIRFNTWEGIQQILRNERNVCCFVGWVFWRKKNSFIKIYFSGKMRNKKMHTWVCIVTQINWIILSSFFSVKLSYLILEMFHWLNWFISFILAWLNTLEIIWIHAAHLLNYWNMYFFLLWDQLILFRLIIFAANFINIWLLLVVFRITLIIWRHFRSLQIKTWREKMITNSLSTYS